MSSRLITDAKQRALARDPSRSVIVQAPAGSGKTELLMQRFLALLACVDEPEEILAVTFTRKAAAEMRHRILAALQPAEPDERLPETAELAEQVLRRDSERGWQLLNYPSRLRVDTLDSVNGWLGRTAPILGDGSGSGEVVERPDELYELAAQRTLEHLVDDDALSAAVQTVLQQLDNSTQQFVGLMAQMLKRRDQWLPIVGSGELSVDARELLEGSLRELVTVQLEATGASLGLPLRVELTELLSYAAENLRVKKPDEPICAWRDTGSFPGADADFLPDWKAVVDFCLKRDAKNPAFRKTVNVGSGFPPVKTGRGKEMKDQAVALLARLTEADAGKGLLAEQLNSVRSLPEPRFSDEQWLALQAVIQLLPVLAAELLIVFRERGQTDFPQKAQEALTALADESGPTRLALRLDYQIKHILIDEFQDTSRTQYALLKHLTAGWAQDDGRSLFVVGDPMQSIYRFRQAEVALFLQLWERGINDILLSQVRLKTNFRSDPKIVNWVNEHFAQLMPGQNDPATGAVQFAPGAPHKDPLPEGTSAVVLQAFAEPGRVDEANYIADLVADLLQKYPQETVGILVRKRSQARLIAPALRARGIAFSGEGLELAGESSIEQDLIALARALSHLADRTAWLALLRAPWCGLNLVDLERLCASGSRELVWAQLHDAERLKTMSADGQSRVAGFVDRMAIVLAQQTRSLALRDRVEGAWQLLDGPAALSSPRELELAGQFFTVLDTFDEGGNIAEAFLLHERLPDRKATNAGAVQVNLLTLFGAKGLEYDTVILPGLDASAQQSGRELLAWHEFSDDAGNPRFLMAPVAATGSDSSELHQLIRQFDSVQASNELDRFLYVATTRAKQRLHLCFELKKNKDGEISKPRAGSMLDKLWPVIEGDFADFAAPEGTPEAREKWLQPKIRRFTASGPAYAIPAAIDFESMAIRGRDEELRQFDWAGRDAMRVGVVAHRCLQHIAEQRNLAWLDDGVIRSMLADEGVSPEGMSDAAGRVQTAIELTVNDAKGRWILEAEDAASCEFPVTARIDGRVQHLVIDRSFVAEDGVRWIVDYKTSSHQGGGLEQFLEAESSAYREKMLAYRQAMQMLEPDREIRLALYFPLLSKFLEINT